MNASAEYLDSVSPTPATSDGLLVKVAIASVLQNPTLELPGNLRAVLDLHDHLDLPEHRAIACAIVATVRAGEVPDLVNTDKRTPREHKHDLQILANDTACALNLERADFEVHPLLEHLKSNSILATIGEAFQEAKEHPARSAKTAMRLVEALNHLHDQSRSRDGLTIRTPDEILAMKFDEDDRILGDRLLSKGSILGICGPGSIGKSRFLLQLMAAMLAGLPFCGFQTRGQGLKILVLQAENSNRRLQSDLAALRVWVGEKHWPQVEASLRIHTLETDADGFLSLDNEQTQGSIRDVIKKLSPDIVAWDSLYNFAAGNLNSDEDMAATCLAIARLSRTGNSQRAIVVLHHAGTGKAGAARATGYDRTGYSRNSKVFHSWVRAQLNLAPGCPDSSEVLVASCGKCSDGPEFPAFAVRLNPDTMIYSPDESFDMDAWLQDVTGNQSTHDMTVDRVKELCAGAMTKAQLAKKIQGEGPGRTAAFNWVKRAAKAGKLHWTKSTETYVAKP